MMIIIKQEGNLEPTSQMFVGYVNLFLPNSQATIFQIAIAEFFRNPLIESIELLQPYTIAAGSKCYGGVYPK